MTEAFLAWELLHLEHRIRRLERRTERKEWRDNHDPFDLHDDEFIKLYRLSPDIVIELTNVLRSRLEIQRISGINPERQILITLHSFYKIVFYGL